jgi:hypothetical protein
MEDSAISMGGESWIKTLNRNRILDSPMAAGSSPKSCSSMMNEIWESNPSCPSQSSQHSQQQQFQQQKTLTLHHIQNLPTNFYQHQLESSNHDLHSPSSFPSMEILQSQELQGLQLDLFGDGSFRNVVSGIQNDHEKHNRFHLTTTSGGGNNSLSMSLGMQVMPVIREEDHFKEINLGEDIVSSPNSS